MTLAQLFAAGLSRAAIARRVAAGKLHRVHRGVYAVGHAALSHEGQCMAAVLALGDGSAVSHLTAAGLVRISRFRASLIAAVTISWRHPEGVDVHHTKRLDPRDVTRVKGIPCTTVPRTLVDLTDIVTPHQLANVIHEADFKHLFNLEETHKAMARANGRKNLHILEEALHLNAAGSAGTKSGHEDHLLQQLQLAGIETPLVNTKLNGVEVDMHWPDDHLIIEVDGPGHDRPRTQREDADRGANLNEFEIVRVKYA